MNTFIWDPEVHPEQQYTSMKEQVQVRVWSAFQMNIHTVSRSTLSYLPQKLTTFIHAGGRRAS